MAAPRINAADIARDNPDFARRNPELRNRTIAAEPAGTPVRRGQLPKIAPSYGPSPGVRNAAAATNRAASRVGRAQRVARRGFGGGGSIAGVIVFATGVGVFLWLVRNPTVLPKLIAFVTTIIHDVLTLGVHP